MCRITDPVLLPIWTQCYGSTYHEVTGGKLVEKFVYFGETYEVGDIIEMFDPKNGVVSLEAEIVSSGSNMFIQVGRWNRTPHNRRAILLKVIRRFDDGGFVAGRTFGAFFRSGDEKRIRHAALEALARI
jgi:hypothetical protein